MDEATRILEAAIELDQYDAWSLWQLGETYLAANEYRRGRECFKRWRTLAHRTFPLRHHWLMYCYALTSLMESLLVEAGEMLENAVNQADSYLSQDFNYWDNRFNRALFQLVGGKTELGLERYRALAGQSPEMVRVKEAQYKLELLTALQLSIPGQEEALAILKAIDPVPSTLASR